jgi:hypothetical protein
MVPWLPPQLLPVLLAHQVHSVLELPYPHTPANQEIVIKVKNLLTFQMIHECWPVRQSSFPPNWFHPPPHPRQYWIPGLLLFRHSASPRIWGSLCRNLFKDSYSKKVWNRPIWKALTTHYQLVMKASCIEGKRTTNLTIFAELQNHITCTCQNFVAVPPYQLDFSIMQANAHQGRLTSLSTNATSNCNRKKSSLLTATFWALLPSQVQLDT